MSRVLRRDACRLHDHDLFKDRTGKAPPRKEKLIFSKCDKRREGRVAKTAKHFFRILRLRPL